MCLKFSFDFPLLSYESEKQSEAFTLQCKKGFPSYYCNKCWLNVYEYKIQFVGFFTVNIYSDKFTNYYS